MNEQTMQEAIDQTWAMIRATDAQMKATDARLDQRFAETDQKLRRLEGMFGIQWGRLIEALVAPAALQIFRDRGIDVHTSFQRQKSRINGRSMELDIVLENDLDSVVIEVKSLMNVEDVNEFLADLDQVQTYFTHFQGRRIYGAVAALEFAANADQYAYRRGLFVLGLTGEGVVQILNNEQFAPKDFGGADVRG
ncbi:MAG: DUF3782 domain-containing protein [Caldilineaceae bacterium]|nr:DUF3782 domain-containing protein [Caldilineaceae bacterium]